MQTQITQQPNKEEQAQSGKQVAIGITVFIVGLSLLLLLLKYLIG